MGSHVSAPAWGNNVVAFPPTEADHAKIFQST